MLSQSDVTHSSKGGTLFYYNGSAQLGRLESINRVAEASSDAEILVPLSLQPGPLTQRSSCSLDDTARRPRSRENGAKRYETETTRNLPEGPMDVSQSLAWQQRSLIKLTDKVLLKRTQVLHQQGTVDACRGFLNSSLTEVNMALGLWRSGDPGTQKTKKKGKRKKCKKKPDESLGEKVDGKIDREADERVDEKIDRMVDKVTGEKAENNLGEDSGKKIGGDFDEKMEGGSDGSKDDHAAPIAIQTPSLSGPDLGKGMLPDGCPQSDPRHLTVSDVPFNFNSLFEQYQTDYQTLLREESQLKTLSDELSGLEYGLVGLHQRFRDKLSSREFAGELHSALQNVDLEPPMSSERSSRADTETPTLIAEYFDKKGDANVFRERLDELENWFHEGLAEREVIADRGDSLDVSDQQYRETFGARQRGIEEEIRVAEEKAEALAERCRQASLDINRYRRTGPSIRAASTEGYASSIFGTFHPTENRPHQSLFPDDSVQGRSLMGRLSSNKVDSWLRNLSIQVADSTALPNEEQTVEPEQKVNSEDGEWHTDFSQP